MTTYNWVNIGSGNGLLLDGTCTDIDLSSVRSSDIHLRALSYGYLKIKEWNKTENWFFEIASRTSRDQWVNTEPSMMSYSTRPRCMQQTAGHCLARQAWKVDTYSNYMVCCRPWYHTICETVNTSLLVPHIHRAQVCAQPMRDAVTL